MKHLLFLIGILYLLPFEAKSNFLDTDETYFQEDQAFKDTSVPEEWQDKSAVIIARRCVIRANRSSSYRYSTEKYRNRIALLDATAVEKYSELYFNKKTSVKVFIQKANGKKIEVDANNFIDSDGDVPRHFRTFSSANEDYKKLAVPSLQIGDIIDYQYSFRGKTKMESDPERYVFTLEAEYPIEYQRFDFEVDKDFRMMANSYNSAPEFQSCTPGKHTERVSKDDFCCFLIDEMRESEPGEIWSNITLSAPYIKVGVIANLRSQNYFKNVERDEVITEMTTEDVAEMLGLIRPVSLGVVNSTVVHNYLRLKFGRKFTVNKEVLEEAYYCYRNNTFFQLMRGGEDDLIKWNDLTDAPILDGVFINQWGSLLTRLKCDFEYVAFVAKGSGGLDHLLMADDLSMAIKVNLPNEEVYIYPYTNFSTFNEKPSYTHLAEEITIKPQEPSSKKLKKGEAHLPEDHREHNTLSVHIDLENELTKVEREVINSGEQKNRIILWALHGERPLMQEEFLYNIDDKWYYDRATTQVLKMRETLADERKEERKEYFKAMLEKDFDLEYYSGIDVKSLGIFKDQSDLIYTEDFNAKNMVKRAGPNYIFSIGELIEGQVQITEDQRDRVLDIYSSNPRQYENDITVTIPDGYNVEGIDALNYLIQNSSGEFSSIAKLEGNRLNLITKKVYKESALPKEKWPEMLEFLDAAHELYQQKILLKKI